MSLLRRFDAACMSSADRFARRMHRGFGVSTYTLLAACAWVLLASDLIHVIAYWLSWLMPDHVGIGRAVLGASGVIACSILIVWAIGSRSHESDALPMWLGTWRSICRVWFRLLILSAVPAGFINAAASPTVIDSILHSLEAVAFAVFVYLVHVDPLPPARGRLREWLSRTFLPSISAPVPVPVRK